MTVVMVSVTVKVVGPLQVLVIVYDQGCPGQVTADAGGPLGPPGIM